MAETFMNALGGNRFEAESAGLEPTEINPLVIEVMKEVGFDLSGKQPQSVFEFYKEGRLYEHVITVCDQASGGKCPIFPGLTSRTNHPFPDPAGFTGTHQERLQKTREVRDQIKIQVEQWLQELDKTHNTNKT
jgi:arsenate reductase